MPAAKPTREVPIDKLADRAYPHQVAIPSSNFAGRDADNPFVFCRGLDIYLRTHRVSDGNGIYEVFCFRDPRDAEAFRSAFDGIPFYPEDRTGEKWRRPPGDIRRTRRARGPDRSQTALFRQ